MLLRRFIVSMFSAGLMVLGAGGASSQNYPNKPIRIVTAEVGGGTDFASRVIAPGLSGSLGQQVIVENRPSGVIPGETVAKAPPDGYTLLLTGNVFWIAPLLQETPYDVVSDFSPITLVASAPTVLVVNPSLPVKSVEELIALAKAKPGELNYASPSAGSSPHLAAELFAPGKTPMLLIDRLNQEIVRVLNRADVKGRFLNVGVETVGSTPGEFAATIRSEMAKLGKVIKDAGIRAD